MFRTLFFSTLAVVCLVEGMRVASLAQQAPGGTAQWVATLQGDASTFDKAMACRRLAATADPSAVPALSGLLADPHLAAYARTALETIRDPSAGAALREAVARLQGPLLVGVLDTIGQRRDADSVDAVKPLLAAEDPAVATAAARCLGRIANTASAGALRAALGNASPELRPAVAHAALLAAGRLRQAGDASAALALYDAVRQADLPEHLVLPAIQGAIVVRGPEGRALLDGQLRSADEATFRFGLQAARELSGVSVETLVAVFDTLTPQRQALAIAALSDIGDRAAVPVLLQAAKAGTPEVRIAAIDGLARFGDPAAVPLLLAAAVEPQAEIAQAAHEALATLDSGDITAAIVRMLDAEEPRTLEVAVLLAGRRSIAEATPALVRRTDHADPAVRKAAIRALGATVNLGELAELIALAAAPKHAELADEAYAALRAACVRLPREECVKQLRAAMENAAGPPRVRLLEQIAAVGGPLALETVVAAARGGDTAMQDAATRLLGEWMTIDAAAPLLDMARTAGEAKYRIRALRGYIRLARQLNMAPDERLAVCRNALAIAQRNDEKVLAVETLGRIGTAPALELAVSLLDQQPLREAACAAIVEMSTRSVLAAPDRTEQALRRVLAVAQSPALKENGQAKLPRVLELAQQQREENLFAPLWDGTTLEGWEGAGDVFRVADGAIVGGRLDAVVGGGNDFLCTTKEYGDFELRLEWKFEGDGANGGVNVRSRRNPDNGVAVGYQADLGDGYWGCLFDEARRNRVLAQPAASVEIRPGEWNDYRIRCEGPRIRLWVNGVATVDYTETDAAIPLRGILALQVQAGRKVQASYRNLRIRELPDPQ